jgi:hypothetical protein
MTTTPNQEAPKSTAKAVRPETSANAKKNPVDTNATSATSDVKSGAPSAYEKAGGAPLDAAQSQSGATRTSQQTGVESDDDGFTRVNPEFYFWQPSTEEDGRIIKHTLFGIVLARFRRAIDMNEPDIVKRNTPKHYYVVVLTRPCVAKDHEKVSAMRPRGSIVQVDERFNLKGMVTMFPKLDENGEPVQVTEVKIDPIKTVPTGKGGNRVWKINLDAKKHSAPTAKLLAASTTLQEIPLLSVEQAKALTSKSDEAPENTTNDLDDSFPPLDENGGGQRYPDEYEA